MPISLERKLPYILLFVLAMMLLIAYVSYRNTRALEEAVKWEKHTRDVLLRLDETMISMLDIETGMRGFFITGDETYLQPFEDSKPVVSLDIADLRQLTSDNPDEQKRLDELEAIANSRIENAAKNIEIKRSGDPAAIKAAYSTPQGRQLMDRVRVLAGEMKQAEQQLLNDREASLQGTLSTNRRVIFGSSLAGILSLILASTVAFVEIRRRWQAEDELRETNHQLEERVIRRTSELAEANQHLSQTVESEQAARKEAELANQLRDEFMAVVTHELRTPLNAILGWSRLLQGGRLDGDAFNKAVDTIIRSSETQNRLIQDLLDAARLIAGKLELDLKDVRLVDLIVTSIEAVRPSLEARGISLNVDIADDCVDAEIHGDENRLKQAIWNILTNAIKFSSAGDGRIILSVAKAGENIQIAIADNGKGISREFLPLVFERFRQDNKNAERKVGLGLGLAIVKHLVELHGGTVSAHSDGEDKGSAFTITLPAVTTPIN
jgi:signal transduction histidine kinase